MVEVAFRDDKIQFRHYCSDAMGKKYHPEALGGYSLRGEVEDGAPIEKGKTVAYSLIYKMPLGLRQGIKYVIDTRYQGETAGRVRTSIPWSEVKGAARR